MHHECSHFDLWRGAWIVVLIALFAPAPRVSAAESVPSSAVKPVAAPRSADELRAILAKQPDFAAAVLGCNVKRPTGDRRVGRLARRGNTYRIEFSPTFFDRGPGGTISMGQIAWLITLGAGPDDEPVATALVPDRKEYFSDGEDFGDAFLVAVLGSPYVSFLSRQYLDGVCGLRDAGTDVVNGLRCMKIEAATRQGEVVVFYAAEKLDNLVVRIVVRASPSQGFGGPFQSLDFDGAVIDLEDVRLGPPRSLFDVPTGYRKLDAPELYLEEGETQNPVAAAPSACPEPSMTGEVSLRELCPPKVPVNKGPICGRILVERSRLRVGETSKLEAAVVDPDGDMIRYTWSATGGPVLTGKFSERHFDATGLAPGAYVVTVTADDGHGHQVTCSTTIEVVPNE